MVLVVAAATVLPFGCYSQTASYQAMSDVPTKIEFERSGGFAGVTLSVVIQLDQLPEEEAQHLRGLVQNAHIFELQSPPRSPDQVDAFQYTLNVHTQNNSKTLTFDESNISAEAKPLIQILTKYAKAQRRSAQ